ncbi:MAG TPA: ATP-binding protein [Thermoanaerobaculia bacterium]|nr:ATP-binding protein [Thermoanaerobaculia bacterium]
MKQARSDREASSSRRRLASVLVAHGSIGFLILVTVTFMRGFATRETLRALGPSAWVLIAIFAAFALALSLLKFKLTESIFVAFGLTAVTTMLPLLGPVLSAWIAVTASATSRLLGIRQIGPNKSVDPAMDALRAFAQFATYGVPTLFAGAVYEKLGGSTPLTQATWTAAGQIALSGVALLAANHIVMKQVEAAHGYTVTQMLKVSIIDGAVYVTTLPYAIFTALSYPALGAGAIAVWAFTGVLLDYITRNLATTRAARDHLVQQLTSVSNVGKTISLRFTTDELLDAIYKACEKVVELQFFSIALYDEEPDELACELDVRDGQHLPKFRVKMGSGLNAWVVRNRAVLNLASSSEEARFGIVAYDDGKPTESWLGVPMIARERVVGVISVQSYRRRAFSRDDEIVLTTIANQAAVALDDARLYRDLEKLTSDLEERVLDRTNQLVETNVRLQAADRSKNQFLANMSHELRTPLNSIIGFSAVLLTAAENHLPARLFKFIENIHIAGNHLLDLINDILDLSKIEAGRLGLQPAAFDLRQTVTSIERVVKGICAEADVTLLTNVEESVPQVFLDEGRTKQILLNLISNAVKFSPKKSFVRLDVGYVPADASPLHTEAIRLTVTDQGIGMAAEELPKIFDQFYQVENGVIRRKGTGLGLSLTRGFVELHGGAVEVESAVGQGSTFRVTLPVDCRNIAPDEGANGVTIAAGSTRAV